MMCCMGFDATESFFPHTPRVLASQRPSLRATFSQWEKGKPYFEDTYFSRRICGIGRPSAFNCSKQVSTMFGLPHR